MTSKPMTLRRRLVRALKANRKILGALAAEWNEPYPEDSPAAWRDLANTLAAVARELHNLQAEAEERARDLELAARYRATGGRTPTAEEQAAVRRALYRAGVHIRVCQVDESVQSDES